MYTWLMRLLFLPLLGYSLWRAWRHKDWRYAQQRLAFTLPRFRQRPIWVHCASVGEVNAVAPLLRACKQQWPELELLISTNTSSGAAAIDRLQLEQAHSVFLPLDYLGWMRKFVHHIQPRCALITETELWPHLFQACHEATVPVLIINGRLSAKTLHAPAWLQRDYARCLQQTQLILARDAADAAAFIKLGAPSQQVQVAGNIKFAKPQTTPADQPSPLAEAYWLAASTHDPEELLCAQLQQTHAGQLPRLVIVPRHPERRDSIQQQIEQLGLKVALRSRQDDPSNCDVYLADTFGELNQFMRHSAVTFVGGSLIPHGGQNIIEAARAGTAIITGPHMSNFATESQLLLAAGGMRQVADNRALGETLLQLLNDPAARQQQISAAQQVLETQSQVLDNYLQALAPYLR